MFNLEKSIIQWLKLFAKHRAFDHGSVREMELHLRDHIEDLISEGKSEQQAFDLAVEEFGEVPSMANEEFSNIKRKTTIMSYLHTRLLNNYFKTSIRSLLKNPMSSFINIFGLAVAIGICLVVYAFLAYDYSIDRFHEHENEVYLATIFADRDGSEQQYGFSPRPLGKMLLEDFTHIKKMCRIDDGNIILKYEDKVFHESVRYADAEFLEMFTFPLKWGTPKSLEDLNSIIISEDMSIKYFGEQNPIGRNILMKFGENRSKTFKITGVANAFPDARIIDFDFLINFENIKVSRLDYNTADWSKTVNATLIQVNNPNDLKIIEKGMNKYKLLQNEAEKNKAISAFAFEQLTTLRKRSENIRNAITHNYTAPGRIVLPILAIFMLILACFNYINIAIVSASKRLKEIGLRKVIGANRQMIIIQFLTENIFITCFALVLGLILAVTSFLPWFIDLSGMGLELQLIDKNLWLFLTAILLLTGVASGIYPAVYISKFDITSIFKGSVTFGKKNPLTKLFLGLQLILACITITGGVIFTQNTTYQYNRSWGYDQENVLYAEVPEGTSFQQLKDVMMQNPDVVSISGSIQHLGKRIATNTIHMPDEQYEVHQLSIGANYFETMGLELKVGRSFNENYESDKQNIIVNELLVKQLGLEDAIGQIIKIQDLRYEVIGVVNDFHIYSFSAKLRPAIFKVANVEDYRFLSMKVQNGSEQRAFESLNEQWALLFPEIPFQGGYQVDVLSNFFRGVNIESTFMRTVAFIAVLLASLGFYGLVTLNITGRVREFSIRKVLGAGRKNIATIIVKEYMALSFLALFIGAPISYILIKANLDLLYAHPMPLDYTGVIIAVILLTLVLLLVISTQIRKVSNSNPVEGLKVE